MQNRVTVENVITFKHMINSVSDKTNA